MAMTMTQELRFLVTSTLYNSLTSLIALHKDGHALSDDRASIHLKRVTRIISLWSHPFVAEILDDLPLSPMAHFYVRYSIVDMDDNAPPWDTEFTPAEAFEYITDMDNDASKMLVYPVYCFQIPGCTKPMCIPCDKAMHVR